MINADDFLGKFLKKEDITKPQLVTIQNIYSEELPILGGQEANKTQPRMIIKFYELTKPMVMNQTNITTLKEYFKTSDSTRWTGKLVIFVDPNIIFGAKRVGGLRLRAPKNQAPPTEVKPTEFEAIEEVFGDDSQIEF